VSTCKITLTEKPKEFDAYEVNFENLVDIVDRARFFGWSASLDVDKNYSVVNPRKVLGLCFTHKELDESRVFFGDIIVFYTKDGKTVIWGMTEKYLYDYFNVVREPEPPSSCAKEPHQVVSSYEPIATRENTVRITPIETQPEPQNKQSLFNRIFHKGE